MTRKAGFRLTWVVGFLMMALLAPNLGQAKEEPEGGHPGIQREKLVQDLNLAPDKAQAFLAVGKKYEHMRGEVIERIKQNDLELEKALAAPQPDEAKIKEMVATITMDHEKLFDTFKAQRREEMELLTPVQQGKFLLVLKKWHDELRKKKD